MTQIEYNVKSLIKRVKQDESMSEYTFVKGFACAEHPYPLTTYMIAVSTLDTEVISPFVGDKVSENQKGSMHNFTLKFRVYAPQNLGGEGITNVVYQLCEAIKRNDSYNACESIKTSAVAFDNDLMTVYRDVTAQLTFCLIKEGVS